MFCLFLLFKIINRSWFQLVCEKNNMKKIEEKKNEFCFWMWPKSCCLTFKKKGAKLSFGFRFHLIENCLNFSTPIISFECVWYLLRNVLFVTLGDNFINVFRAHFSYESYILAAFSSYMYIEKAAKMNFRTKNAPV